MRGTPFVPVSLAWLGAAALLAPSPLPAQFVDQHFAPIQAVPEAGLYPPAVQADIQAGYRQLEQVTDPSDDTHLEAAKAAFERALAAEPRSVHALNGLGIYELTKDEQWLVILESFKKVFERDHISMAVKAFERALAVDLDSHPARYNLALAHRQTRGQKNYRRAIAELERIVAADPTFADAALLLAFTYRDVGDLEGMMRALEELPETEAFPRAGRQLLLAYALVNSGRPTDGAAAYWKGLEGIEDERQADLYWHDIRPIVLPQTDAEFRRLPVPDRPAFIRSFWQRLADQSFVSPDERVAEQYRRLHYAYQNFRLELPERRHYSSLTAYVPPWQTGFDDRGVIHLRHGEPDDVATYSGPEVERNISWKYKQGDGDPLIFHFVSDEDVSDYKLVRHLSDAVLATNTSLKGQGLLDPHAADIVALRGAGAADADDLRILGTQRVALQDLYRSRGSLDPDYDRAAMDLDPEILETEESKLAEDIHIGTGTQSYEPELPGEPFLFPVDAIPFKGPSGQSVVTFYYAIPTTGVLMLPRGDGNRIDYRYQIRVSSTADPDTTRGQADEEVHLETAKPIPRGPGVMLPGIEEISLTPGDYRYGLRLTDMNSGRFGVYQGSVSVDDFSKPGLALSGIVLASRVEPSTDASNPFVRWERVKVLPLPSRMFRRTQPVYVYYEVYGLRPSAERGEARYRTTYRLAALERDRNVVAKIFSAVGELLTGGKERGAISYSFEPSPTPADPLLEYFSLDVSESEPGEYRLSVEIENLSTGETRRRETELTLVP